MWKLKQQFAYKILMTLWCFILFNIFLFFYYNFFSLSRIGSGSRSSLVCRLMGILESVSSLWIKLARIMIFDFIVCTVYNITFAEFEYTIMHSYKELLWMCLAKFNIIFYKLRIRILYLVGMECINLLIKPLERIHMRDLVLLHTQLPFETTVTNL